MLSNGWLGTFQLDLKDKSLMHIDNFNFVTPSNTGSFASGNKF